MMEVSGINLTGIDVTVKVTVGNSKASDKLVSLLNITQPFSFAFGGGGGSHGGLGGAGYGPHPVGAVYNDERISDLLGGSGGCVRDGVLYNLNAIRGRGSGMGGGGGGVIEIAAANDIIVGHYGMVLMKGGDGEQGAEGGGGGGSGGAISIIAGGVVYNDGVLDVSGGSGGYGGGTDGSVSGGGGGGGRIAIYSESITDEGRLIASGGVCGIFKSNITVS